MLGKWGKITIAITVLISVAIWSINYKQRSQYIQDNGYHLYAMLEDFKEKHHAINDEVLKNTLYQFHNYDLLNKDLELLNQQIKKVQESEIYTTQNFPKTKIVLTKIIAHQNNCSKNIEIFKRENGKIKNSFAFLVSSFEHLMSLDKSHTQKILNLTSRLISVKSSMEIQNFDTSVYNTDFFEKIESKNRNLAMYIHLYQTHINLLKNYLPAYIHLVNGLIKEDFVEDEFNNLYDVVKQENSILLQKLNVEYYVILLFSFITLLIVVFYIIQMEKEKNRILELQNAYKKSITTDQLTGLKNRSAYIDVVHSMDNIIVILIDIVDFSAINNLYGIKIGDFILQKLAKSLEENISCIENTDIFKVGSDHFAIILENYSMNEATLIAQNILEVVERAAYKYDGLEQEIFIQILVGISNLKPYLLNATLAIKSIADDYSDKIAIYENYLDKTQEIQKNLAMIQIIKTSIVEDNIVMFFQPLVDLKTKEIIKYEALVRIKDKDEYISPYLFLELSKKVRLYTQITHAVIAKSIETVQERNIDISINLSIEDILHKETYDFILETLRKNITIASKITFELLESEKINDFNALKEFIKTVKAFGVQIAIDDFGSGYSNYNYLLELDIDILKIDGSMIKNISKSKNNQLVVKSIIEFAKLANIKTVAEFVSSQEIEKVVLELGVDYGQGFYYSAPKLL